MRSTVITLVVLFFVCYSLTANDNEEQAHECTPHRFPSPAPKRLTAELLSGDAILTFTQRKMTLREGYVRARIMVLEIHVLCDYRHGSVFEI